MRCVHRESGYSPRQDNVCPSCQSHPDFWLVWGGWFVAVPTSGCPFQPLLTPWLFLLPVALQMPEGLLMFACTIADIIER